MAENTIMALNGLDDIPEIKMEPVDPLFVETSMLPQEENVSNGIFNESDCDEVLYFTAAEVDSTKKCLENTKLIIKDFETQLDWHLQQYMTLLKNKNERNKKQDFLTVAMLGSIIANHPEGNKKFIKRKTAVLNEKKRKACKEDSDNDNSDSKNKRKIVKGGNISPNSPVFHVVNMAELKVPKVENASDDEEDRKSARKKDLIKQGETSVLNSNEVEVKHEEIDREQWIELLKKKTITTLEDLYIDFDKPIIILKSDNVHKFDFKECLECNVIVTCHSNELLPEFVFSNNVSAYIINGFIKLVQTDVFDHYLSEQIN